MKAIDGEQIAEELDNLDRFLAKKNVENRMKINDLAEDIVSNNMMVSQITAELEQFNLRRQIRTVLAMLSSALDSMLYQKATFFTS